MKISFIIDSERFRRGPSKGAEKLGGVFGRLLDELQDINEQHWQLGKLPLLYHSRVRYARERPGVEYWQDAPSLYKTGFGDCEDLAACLAAEMRMASPNSVSDHRFYRAQAVLLPQNGRLWHAVVIDKDTQQVYDPSRVLGMRGKA